MNQVDENSNIKPIISIEGKMSAKDAGRAVIIMAWGKSISLVVSSIAGAVAAITACYKYFS